MLTFPMNLKKFNKSKKSLEMVNLIPMINLIFLLLVFFLLTGVISKKESTDIDRPASEFGNDVKKFNQDIVIGVNSDNKIVYQNNEINFDKAKDLITSKEKKYILNLDKESSIQLFNKLMQEMKNKGIEKVFVRVSEKKND